MSNDRPWGLARDRVLEPLAAGLVALPRSVVGPRRGRRLLVGLVMLCATLLTLYLVWVGLLYPLRSDAGGPGAWGGPGMAGAWSVHAAVALAVQVPCLLALAVLDRRHRQLGRPRDDVRESSISRTPHPR